MSYRKLRWKKAGAAVLTTALVLQNGFLINPGYALAQENTEVQDFLELTAQELQTEEGDVSYAHLKIGDWLDYGDYGIERTDIPGTDYFFYITTKDEDGNVINDRQLAYCMQSYFLTPLPGDHSHEVTDNVSAIGGENNAHKVFYYGYGGAGYDAAEFEAFLVQNYGEYYETVYAELSDAEKAELGYILTHGAASYAYFTDGTPLEEYLKLQFELKYGENWEKEFGYFKEEELELAGIEDGDLNLFGATYGMNEDGIAMSKAWYEILISKKDPELSITCDNGTYTFNGNEKNEQLALTFTVPEGMECTVIRGDESAECVEAGTEVTVYPSEQFSFVFVDEQVSMEQGGISELTVAADGQLAGAEQEVWNLVLIQTNKGNSETIDKRQQDIAAVSMTDAGKTELDFVIELQKGSMAVKLEDDAAQPVSGAVLGVYYDEAGSVPVSQDGAEVQLTTDSEGEAYLELVINQQLQDNGGKLYVKELSVPAGTDLDETVYRVDVDGAVTLTNSRETMSVRGTVEISLPEGVAAPDEMTVILQQDGEAIDSMTITEAEGWSYEWENLLRYDTAEDGTVAEHQYTVDLTVPDGYVMETEEGQLVIKAAEPASVVIETTVNLTGRDLKEGEFSFELTQVTDVTGESAVEGGIISTAVNDAEGKVTFEGITCAQPGTYYFKITMAEEDAVAGEKSELGADSESPAFIAEVTVTADAADKGQLTAEVTYPNGQPEFEQTYEASGEVVLEGIQVALENGTLEEGAFTVELKDAEGNVLQTAANDADGNVTFDSIAYTQEDIGKEYEYTVSVVDSSAEEVTLDSQIHTITVKVEDGENSDGTLRITQESEPVVFINVWVEPETESEVATEAETESEVATEAVTEVVTEAETEAEVVTETEDVTEAAAEAETEEEAEAVTEAENEEDGQGYILPLSIGLIILLLILFFERARRKADE